MSNGWTVAYGCAIDTSSRVLASPEYYQLMSNNTPEVCTNKCTQRGFTIAAVEYGYECFCASAYTNGVPPQSAPASQCHDPCPGNATETCGGGYRMQIYEAPAAYVDVAALPAGWVETMPCGVDTIDRIFSDTASLTLSDNTPARCIAQCSVSLAFSLHRTWISLSFIGDGLPDGWRRVRGRVLLRDVVQERDAAAGRSGLAVPVPVPRRSGHYLRRVMGDSGLRVAVDDHFDFNCIPACPDIPFSPSAFF
jgi:hypothetical protein